MQESTGPMERRGRCPLRHWSGRFCCSTYWWTIADGAPQHEANRSRILVVQLCYNFRAYPDAIQRRALAQAFGCARVVWNDCLRDRKEAHPAGLPCVKSADLSRLRITQAKRTEERAWLVEVSAVFLQQSLRDLDTADKNFFDSLKGKRQGRKVGPPQYKSKRDTLQSIRLNTNTFCLEDDGTGYVAKLGNLKVKWSRRLPAAPTSLTARPAGSGTAPGPCTSGGGRATRAAPCMTAITKQLTTSFSKDAVSSPPDGRRR
ncbi:RNA-guided endonuclease InsQ/TnpB family protein [Streptomyces sp. NPDC101151]|uniref:RNA-guided endonuclease InsQ/TnpB family protein n=1 Tax=Streptomyces sp. NPDC101151 TaxID=3366115 RepID=UPI0037F6B6FA